jgi:methionine biosynthesis protein MetW
MDAHNPASGTANRVDFLHIADMVEPQSRVLDVGCSDGALLQLLIDQKGVDGRGVELSQRNVNHCVAHGLSVVQGDADTDLMIYPDGAFDYVILSQTIQATQHPKQVLEQMLRIGRHAIVSIPNFGHWRIRVYLGLRGRMPVTQNLPYAWYDTPNIHFCTIKDFVALCDDVDARVEAKIAVNAQGRRVNLGTNITFANLFAEQAVFLLRR